MSSFSSIQSQNAASPIAGHYESVAFETLALLWRRRLLILGFAAAALAAAWLVVSAIPPRYVAEVLLQFDFGRDDAGRTGKTSPAIALDPGSLVESEARIIRSVATARAVVSRLGAGKAEAPADQASPGVFGTVANLLPDTLGKMLLGPFAAKRELSPAAQRDALAAKMRKSLTVTNDTKSYLVSVAYRDTAPARAAEVANAFALEYIRSKMEAAVASARRTSEWYAAQIRDGRASLERLETEIAAFRERTGFVEIGADGADIRQQQLRDVLAQLNVATSARIAEETRLRRAQEVQAAGNVPSASDLAGAPVIQRLLEAEATARKEVSDLTIVMGERHPNVAKARAALEDVQARIRSQIAQAVANIEADVDAARATESAVSARLDLLQRRSIEGKGQETQLKALQADASATRDRVRQLTEGFEQANALGDLKPVVGQVVSMAEVPSFPSSPNVPLTLGLALIGGLASGAAASYLLEKRDRGFRTENEIQLETQAGSFGLVPAIRANPTEADAVIFGEAIRSIVAATFSSKSPPKVVLVTSSVPGEGKTFVALAMARLLSMMGRRVLVIDGSPRRLLIGDGASGPSDMLDRLLSTTGMLSEDERERISVVRRTSGLRDGRDVFSNDSFETMLQQARERYDVVLFEVPPIMLLADIVFLRDQADTIIHVVKWNDTLRSAVSSTLQQLTRLGLQVRGVVLNKVDLAEQRSFKHVDRGAFYRDYSTFYRESA